MGFRTIIGTVDQASAERNMWHQSSSLKLNVSAAFDSIKVDLTYQRRVVTSQESI